MNVEIFVITFHRDRAWLFHCLRSIQKFAAGFSGTTVLYPEVHTPSIKPVCDKFSVTQKTFLEDPTRGFNHHQAMACMADHWCPNADFILHTDSDCIFTEPVRPEDYFVGEKPVLVYAPYEWCINHVNRLLKCWQDAVENALGWRPLNETMQRHPAVHYRWLYPKVREYVERHRGIPFVRYVLEQRNQFPQGFAEYNTLGAYADRYHHDAYYWHDRSVLGEIPSKIRQFAAAHHQPETVTTTNGHRSIDEITAILGA